MQLISRTIMRWLGSVVALLFISSSSPSSEWRSIVSNPLGEVYDLAHGNGIYLSLSDGGGNRRYLQRSTDGGRTWRYTTYFQPLSRVAFNNGHFLLIESQNSIAHVSTTGLNWMEVNLPAPVMPDSLVAGKGLFVAVAADKIITSPDGSSWTTIPDITTEGVFSAVYGDDQFVLGERSLNTGRPITILTSTDGAEWTRVALGPDEGEEASSIVASLAFGNGIYAAQILRTYVEPQEPAHLAQVSDFYSSPDGLAWTKIASGRPREQDIQFFASNFVWDNFDGTFQTSTDLLHWTTRSLPIGSSGKITAATSDGTNYLVARQSGSLLYGSSWDTLKPIQNTEYRWIESVAVNGNIVVAVGCSRCLSVGPPPGFIIASRDSGRTFTALTPPGTKPFSTVRYANGKFIAVGLGQILSSPDGFTWSELALQTSAALFDLAVDGERWVAVGQNGTILTSTDGVTFTPMPSGTSAHLHGITPGNGTWVAVGLEGTILTFDGTGWVPTAPFGATDLQGVAFGNGRFAAIGGTGRIYHSSDGLIWTPGAILGNPDPASLRRIAFGQGMFVVIGDGPGFADVWTSENGLEWSGYLAGLAGLDTFPRFLPTGIDASGGRLYLSGPGSAILRRQSPPATLTLTPAPDNQLRLSVDAHSDGAYQIHTSSTLSNNDWNLLDTFTLTAGEFREWLERAPSAASKFYRVTKQ